jgi:hypothetical protein
MANISDLAPIGDDGGQYGDCHTSEDVSPFFVVCFGNYSILQHVVTHITENLKLLFTIEIIALGGFTNDLEHLCFGSNHQFRM